MTEVVRERANEAGALQAAFVQLAQGWAVPVILFILVLALNLFSLLRLPYAFVIRPGTRTAHGRS